MATALMIYDVITLHSRSLKLPTSMSKPSSRMLVNGISIIVIKLYENANTDRSYGTVDPDIPDN